MQDLLLNHLLLSVLDSETHKEWELQTATQQDIPTTSAVTDFLEARCKALELLQVNQSQLLQRLNNLQHQKLRSVSHHGAMWHLKCIAHFAREHTDYFNV